MARIRSIKPEFWDSPDVARASAVARLCFIGMWNWADDHGRGTANLKEMEGFIFPNDDVSELSGGKSANFRDVVAEVAGTFGVVFYTVRGRPYYAIPSWERHQRNEKRANSKYPGPNDPGNGPHPHLTRDDADSSGNARNLRDTVAENLGGSDPGTGEQGNRGTGEQSPSSHVASDDDGKSNDPAEKYPDHVIELCDHLAEHIKANGNRVGKVGVHWWQAMDRLIRLDDYTPDQVRQVIDWSQQDEFWQGNILSAKKLREKFDQLKTRMFAERNKVTPPQQFQSAAERRYAQGMSLVEDELREFYSQPQEIEQ